jgi:O-antigen/teichoic acid export membrane protein
VLVAQILITIIGIIRTLILPIFFDVPSYGYWEVYMFYTAYTGLFCVGYIDGVYLRYGEYDYRNLPFNLLRSSTKIFIAQLVLLSIVSILLIHALIPDTDTAFAMEFAAMNILVLGVHTLIIYILQITNQFKKYSLFSTVDKIAVLVTIGLMFLANENNFRWVIVADFISKIIVVVIMMRHTKDLWAGKERVFFPVAVKEYWINISVGIKLMIANLMSMLMVGAGRLIIQIFDNIANFAIYSFGITVTGIVITTITAFSLVLYPVLKRLSKENYDLYFDKINIFTRSFGILAMLIYFPAYWLIGTLYENYIEVLLYLNFMFGVVFYQAKMSILNNTFYKVLREEKSMLKANMSCLLLFVVLALTGFYFIRQIWIIALCTFMAMMLRSYLSEIYLQKKLNKKIDLKSIYEVIYLLVFILSTRFCTIFVSFVLVIICCIVYFIAERKSIYQTAMTLLKNK